MGLIGAETAVGAGMGLITGAINDARQTRQQRKLQGMQIEGQKEMGIFNRQQAMQMWKDTNYAAQRKEMEKAGLNVGLMYGMGGGGGTTAATQAGSVGGAQAPVGGGEMGMGLQAGMMQAQINLMEAQANKANVEATKTAGADTALTETQTAVGQQTIQNLIQDAKTSEAKEALTRIESRIGEINANVAEATEDEQISGIKWDLQKTMGEARSALARGAIDEKTSDDVIKLAKITAQNALLDGALKQAQYKEIYAKIENLKEQIRLGDTRNAIDKFSKEIQAEYPNLMNTVGKLINDGIITIEEMGGHTNKGRKIE